MRYQGKITHWKDEQGFGFVTRNDGSEKAFVHIKAFTNRSRRPVVGGLISYELKMDEKRRLSAENIRFMGEKATPMKTSRILSPGLAFASLFLCFLIVASFLALLPFAVLGVYLTASVITFLAYAKDKSAAQNNRWRTQESTLHLFSLIGGWPGALFAHKMLRHKSKKEEFQMVFWATVVLNCGALGWLFTRGDSAFIQSIFGSVI